MNEVLVVYQKVFYRIPRDQLVPASEVFEIVDGSEKDDGTVGVKDIFGGIVSRVSIERARVFTSSEVLLSRACPHLGPMKVVEEK